MTWYFNSLYNQGVQGTNKVMATSIKSSHTKWQMILRGVWLAQLFLALPFTSVDTGSNPTSDRSPALFGGFLPHLQLNISSRFQHPVIGANCAVGCVIISKWKTQFSTPNQIKVFRESYSLTSAKHKGLLQTNVKVPCISKGSKTKYANGLSPTFNSKSCLLCHQLHYYNSCLCTCLW